MKINDVLTLEGVRDKQINYSIHGAAVAAVAAAAVAVPWWCLFAICRVHAHMHAATERARNRTLKKK